MTLLIVFEDISRICDDFLVSSITCFVVKMSEGRGTTTTTTRPHFCPRPRLQYQPSVRYPRQQWAKQQSQSMLNYGAKLHGTLPIPPTPIPSLAPSLSRPPPLPSPPPPGARPSPIFPPPLQYPLRVCRLGLRYLKSRSPRRWPRDPRSPWRQRARAARWRARRSTRARTIARTRRRRRGPSWISRTRASIKCVVPADAPCSAARCSRFFFQLMTGC
jgi:hypothetical protein